MKHLAKLLLVVIAFTALASVTPPVAQAGGQQVSINHKGRVISVSLSAVPAHLLHGDLIVAGCDVPPCGDV